MCVVVRVKVRGSVMFNEGVRTSAIEDFFELIHERVLDSSTYTNITVKLEKKGNCLRLMLYFCYILIVLI